MTETRRGRVVDAALALAERRSWEEVRLHDVAAEIGIGLNDVRVQFREKEEIVDAWFDRADEAMLGEAAKAEIAGLTPRQRLHRLVMAWLGALAPVRRERS